MSQSNKTKIFTVYPNGWITSKIIRKSSRENGICHLCGKNSIKEGWLCQDCMDRLTKKDKDYADSIWKNVCPQCKASGNFVTKFRHSDRYLWREYGKMDFICVCLKCKTEFDQNWEKI